MKRGRRQRNAFSFHCKMQRSVSVSPAKFHWLRHWTSTNPGPTEEAGGGNNFPPRCFVLMHRNSLEFGGYLLFRHPVGPTQKIGYRVGSTRNVAAFQAFYAYLLTLDRYLGPHEVQSGVRTRQLLWRCQGDHAVWLHLELDLAGCKFPLPMFQCEQHWICLSYPLWCWLLPLVFELE